MIISVSVSAATNVTGDIKADTTWALVDSPYLLLNDIEVKENSTLTIEPGVVVQFNGSYRLDIEGGLIAEGNSISPIEFVSSGGGEVYFEYTSTSGDNSLRYCRFNNTRLETYESSVDVRDSIFRGRDMVIRGGNFTMYVSNNTFTNCGSNAVMRGIFPGKHIYATQNDFYNCTPELRGREDAASYVYFSNNTAHGSTHGVAVLGWAQVSYNTIHNNTYGIDINDAYGEVNLSHNLIYNNSVGIYVEDLVDGGVVAYNTITLNNIGIFVNEYLGEYSYNNLHDNFEYGVRAIDIEHSMPSEEMMMIHNWWGTDHKQDIDDYIYDYYDNADLPEAVYIPYLDTVVCEAPSFEPLADENCDGEVTLDEVVTMITRWANEEVSLSAVVDAINSWAG